MISEYKLSVQITCVINGVKKMPAILKHFIHRLKDCNPKNVSVYYTEYKGHAVEVSKICADAGVDLIIAVGGDGTFNEVLNGIFSSVKPDTPICLIPNGTGNDFCTGQKISFDDQKILQAIRNMSFKYFDTGLITQGQQKRYFLNVMDIGFGGLATMLLDRQRKKGIHGGLSYSLAILRTFLEFKKPHVEIKIDGRPYYTGKLMMLAISNGHRFGNGLIIHPDARPDDGLLGVTLLGNVGLIDYVLNLSNLKKGRYIKHKHITYSTCTTVAVRVLSGSAPIETDGEIFGYGDIDISIVPASIRLLLY